MLPIYNRTSEKRQFAKQQQGGGGYSAQAEYARQQEGQIPPDFNPMTSPVNPAGQKLPTGALRWDLKGDPYFGEGFSNWTKKFAWSIKKDRDKINPEDWTQWQEKWNLYKSNFNQMGLGEQAGTGAGLGLQAAEMAWKSKTEEGLGASAGRLTEGVFMVLGDSLNWIDEKKNMVLGAVGGYSEAGRDVQSDMAQFEDTAVGEVSIEYAGAVSEMLNNGFEALNLDWEIGTQYADWVKNQSGFGVAYNVARLLFSPNRKNMDLEEYVDRGQALGRVFGSAAFDEGIRQEFIRRYNQGEDPIALAQELQNPVSEFVFNFVTDPIDWLVPVLSGLKTVKAVDRVDDLVHATKVISSPELRQSVDFLTEAVAVGSKLDDAESIRHIDALVDAYKGGHAALLEGDLIKQTYKAAHLTSAGNAGRQAQEIGDFMSLTIDTMKQRFNPEQIVEFLTAGVKAASGRKEDIAKAMPAFMRYLGGADVMFSDRAMEAFYVMRKLYEDEDGVVDLMKFGEKLASSTSEDMITRMGKIVDEAATKFNPSVTDMRKAVDRVKKAKSVGETPSPRDIQLMAKYEDVPKSVRRTEKFFYKPEEIKKGINNRFGFLIFSLHPGPAIKNMISNTEHILLDAGPKAWTRGGKWLTNNGVIEKLDKFMPGKIRAGKGFAGGETPAVLAGKLMEFSEAGGSRRIYLSALQDTLDARLVEGVALRNQEILRVAGMGDKEIMKLQQMLRNNLGNIEETKKAFRTMFGKDGQLIDEWQTLDFLTPESRNVLRQFGFEDSLEELAAKGATPDELTAWFTDVYKEIADKATVANRQIVDDSDFLKNLPGWADNLDINERNQLAAVMKAADEADWNFREALGKFASDIQPRTPEEQQFKDSVRQMLQNVQPRALEVGDESRAMMVSANELYDRVRGGLPGEAYAVEYAKMFGKTSKATNKKERVSELWKAYRDAQEERWLLHYSTVFEQADGHIEIAKQLFGDMENSITALSKMHERAWKDVEAMRKYQAAVMRKGVMYAKPSDARLFASAYGVTTPQHYTNIAKMYGSTAEAERWVDVTDLDEMERVMEAHRVAKGLPEPDFPEVPLRHGPVSMSSAWAEQSDGIANYMANIHGEIRKRMGKGTYLKMDDAKLTAIDRYLDSNAGRIAESKHVAQQYAEAQREFTMLDYGKKTYGDVALSYLLPYEFWYRKAYKNWASRLATNPALATAYLRKRDMMEKINVDQPEWMKQTMKIESLFGHDLKNPIYLNLEKTLNPLDGVTGTNFDDPDRRADWFSNTLDNVGSFGPSPWIALTLGNAMSLKLRGEEEAARAWGSRVLPQSKFVKEMSATFLGKPLEIDPAVWIFSGGMDKWEENRTGVALGKLAQMGEISPEEALDAGYNHTGSAWEKAYQLQAGENSMFGVPGAATVIDAMFGSSAVREKTPQDERIDEMFTQLGQIMAYSEGGFMDPDQKKAAFSQLQSAYPELQAVLLSRKAGPARDTAYAYTVLSRLQPGMTDDTLKTFGITYAEIEDFYASGGWVEGSQASPLDRKRFMAAVAQIAGAIQIPDGATRREWDLAKDGYKAALETIEDVGGSDIWDKVDIYYELKASDADLASEYLSANPDVKSAMQAKQALIIGDPLLFAYYGSMETVENYYVSDMFETLGKEFTAQDELDRQEYYMLLKIDGRAARKWKAAHPNIVKYNERKAELQYEILQKVDKFADNLPEEARPPEYRGDPGADWGFGSQALQDLYRGEPEKTMADWQEVMSPPTYDAVMNYIDNGTPIPYMIRSEVEYIASRNGLSTSQLLNKIAISE